MAGVAGLNAATGLRLAVLLAGVLLVHALALDWLARHLEQPAPLRPLATPMFTRLLQPQAPAAAPAQPAAPVARARPRPAQMTSIASSAVAPAPQPAASEPAREETVAPSTPAGTETAATPAAPLPALPISAAAPSPSLDAWPVDTRLNYRLGGKYLGNDLHGTARVQWQRQDNRYQARIEIDLTLLTSLVLTSQGEVTAQGLLPRVYEEQTRRTRGAKLGDQSITLADGRNLPRPAGVQDTASQFVELTHRFASGKDALEVGRSVSFWMARPGAVDLWTYDIVEREILQTPGLGAVEAFHLKPRPIANPRGNITAEMWFAPSLQYLPVRIRVNMGDTFVDLIVVTIEQR